MISDSRRASTASRDRSGSSPKILAISRLEFLGPEYLASFRARPQRRRHIVCERRLGARKSFGGGGHLSGPPVDLGRGANGLQFDSNPFATPSESLASPLHGGANRWRSPHSRPTTGKAWPAPLDSVENLSRCLCRSWFDCVAPTSVEIVAPDIQFGHFLVGEFNAGAIGYLVSKSRSAAGLRRLVPQALGQSPRTHPRLFRCRAEGPLSPSPRRRQKSTRTCGRRGYSGISSTPSPLARRARGLIAG